VLEVVELSGDERWTDLAAFERCVMRVAEVLLGS
jgi:hypothetical protein